MWQWNAFVENNFVWAVNIFEAGVFGNLITECGIVQKNPNQQYSPEYMILDIR